MDAHKDTPHEAGDNANADPETEACGWLPLDDADDCMMQCEYAGCYPWLTDFIGAHPHDPTLRTVCHTGAPANDDRDAWEY